MALARLRSSRAFSFASGVGAAALGCGAVYLVCDTLSDVVTLRACQALVLPLAAQSKQLAGELGTPIAAGPMFSARLRVSETGRLVQCQFRLDGTQRSSDATATVRRPPYASSFLYNLTGPGTWELLHCHVLVGGEGATVRSVNLMETDGEKQASMKSPPAHLFRHGPREKS